MVLVSEVVYLWIVVYFQGMSSKDPTLMRFHIIFKKKKEKKGVFDHNARVSCTREINLEGAHCTPNNFILEGPNMCQHEILLEIAGAI